MTDMTKSRKLGFTILQSTEDLSLRRLKSRQTTVDSIRKQNPSWYFKLDLTAQAFDTKIS
jgi:hypothetical protein